VTYAYGTGDATTVSYAYDNDGRKLSETDSLGHATSYTYDAAGDLLSEAGVKGNFTYAYDNARNRVSMTDGDNNKTTYVYDARKRLTETDYPDSTKKTYAYDGPGNLTLVTDQASNQVQYSYDAANQLSNVVELNSPNSGQNTTIYGYDGDGNPIVFQDANTHTTNQSFDLFNELSTKTLPDGSLSETRTYDANGNLQTVQHFNGVTTTYAYDSLNRLLSRSTPGEPTVSFTYTETGKRHTMTDSSGTTTYNYDNMDRLTSKQTPEGTLSYTYDAAGNLASIASSNANGASMSYTYDSLNRLSSVADKLGTSNYTYDGASNVSTVTYPNGVQTDYQQYDAMNRILQMATQNSGYIYQRGPTGNLTNATELNGRTVQWSFDGIYRLTNEQITGDPNSQNNGTAGYGLDPVGNRLSDTSSLAGVPSGSWSYNRDDELTNETYDQDGNVTAANGKTFSYDSQNEMLSMNGGAAQMLYDGDGNRVAKSVTSGGVTTTTDYLVDDLNPTGLPQVMDELTNGVVTRTYTYGLQRISEDQIVNGAWTPSFYSYDGMGSVRQLTDMNGTVTDSYEYDAFGNQISHTGSTPNNMLYRGEQFDPDLGLYYLRARYYNPLTGRFMSRDPRRLCDCSLENPTSQHAYVYASADPVNRIDPGGRSDTVETAGGYLNSLKAIGQRVVIPAAGFGAGVTTGTGLWAVTAAILCRLSTDTATIQAVTKNLGFVQTLYFYASGCTAFSRIPGKDIGPYPAPFYPDETWATQPGNPWHCEANAEGRVTYCWKECPDGGKEWFTWDPGTKYGEHPHWDWHRCDNTTCKIYTDGSSTCPPEGEPVPE
jgi:RHS repeat-associated protein